MKQLILVVLLAAVSPVLAEPQTKSMTVSGYVVDSACLFVKDLDKPISKECALSCAKAGSHALVIDEIKAAPSAR